MARLGLEAARAAAAFRLSRRPGSRLKLVGRIVFPRAGLRSLDGTGGPGRSKNLSPGTLIAVLLGQEGVVVVEHRVGTAAVDETAAIEQDRLGAKTLDERGIVTDEKDGHAAFVKPPNAGQALLLKVNVPHGEGFVDDQHLGLHAGGHGEGKAHRHAGGISAQGLIDEILQFGELDDLGSFGGELSLAEPRESAIEKNVLPAGELLVKSHTQLQQRRYAPLDGETARGRDGRAGQEFEQGRLTSAVDTHDSQGRSGLNFEVDIAQRPERPPPGEPARQAPIMQPVDRPIVDRVTLGKGLSANHGREPPSGSSISSYQSEGRRSNFRASRIHCGEL